MHYPLSACYSLTEAQQARTHHLARAAELQRLRDTDGPINYPRAAHLSMRAGNSLIALGLWLRTRGTSSVHALQPIATTPMWLAAPVTRSQANGPSITLLYWGCVTYGLGGGVQRAYLAPLLPIPMHAVPALLSGTAEQTLRP